MPPKASSTSLQGGRSSRKGFKLALPEPSSKNISPSKTRSSTQFGSSTQKCKQQDGSFTLLIEIKPKSSTQEPSKNQPSKQAKADYAFPSETLLALQEIGLTKLPKKTWADIASELDDEYSKTENKQFPSLQRHGFVKWWNQFDTSKAQLDKVKIWFKTHLEFLKAYDLETSLILNHKSQLAAFLARSNSKEHLMKKLKDVLQLLQSQDERSSSSKKEDTNSSNHDNDFYQNEDDCFGKKIGFLSSVIVLIVEPEISSKWSWLNSVVITTSIVSNTTTTNVNRSFAIRWKAELEHTWHLLDNSGNMHSITYNQDLVSSTLLAGWTKLRDFYGLTGNHQVTLIHFGQSVFFLAIFKSNSEPKAYPKWHSLYHQVPNSVTFKVLLSEYKVTCSNLDVSNTMYSFMKAVGFTNLNLEGITKCRIVYIRVPIYNF
ncbi:hypothetical protein D0Y65_041563 [Glycine soja]|uniref:Uncharacterized protein n=1 Tax=Glycine soja TaxID=3848 RepID=A0A445GW92_GLYSO|nr:hypothetical protein D0Y65_041563 [Glycine soja]